MADPRFHVAGSKAEAPPQSPRKAAQPPSPAHARATVGVQSQHAENHRDEAKLTPSAGAARRTEELWEPAAPPTAPAFAGFSAPINQRDEGVPRGPADPLHSNTTQPSSRESRQTLSLSKSSEAETYLAAILQEPAKVHADAGGRMPVADRIPPSKESPQANQSRTDWLAGAQAASPQAAAGAVGSAAADTQAAPAAVPRVAVENLAAPRIQAAPAPPQYPAALSWPASLRERLYEYPNECLGGRARHPGRLRPGNIIIGCG